VGDDLSSVTGGVLRRIDAEPNAGRLAANPIAIGDVDGDGRSEIAMLTREGRVGCVLLSVLAGSDGRVVRRFDLEYGGEDDHWPFRGRYSLALAPRGAQRKHASRPRGLGDVRSAHRLDSRRNGYWQHEREKNVYLGSGVVCPGDLDGDDIEDLWVGVDDNDEQGGGCVYARSGRDDHVRYTFGDDFDLDQTREAWRVGTSVAAVGDIDGDGVCDGLVGTDHTLSQSRGMAFAFSGKTGNLIFRFTREEDDVHTWLPDSGQTTGPAPVAAGVRAICFGGSSLSVRRGPNRAALVPFPRWNCHEQARCFGRVDFCVHAFSRRRTVDDSRAASTRAATRAAVRASIPSPPATDDSQPSGAHSAFVVNGYQRAG
jgi:hypothetical protein